jgi:hypothetical protein
MILVTGTALQRQETGHDLTAANHVDDSSLTIGRKPR